MANIGSNTGLSEARVRLESLKQNHELHLLQEKSNSKPEIEESQDVRIVTGAFFIGKVPTQCEDAYFITERGFGVADGVSGWNDYGFSSSAFAN